MISSRTTLMAALAAAAAFGSATGASAQVREAAFLPWLGCWEAIAADRGAAFGDATPILCVRENADGEGIVVATLADGELRGERELRADGELTAVDEGGCSGWESVAWSGDGHRLYLSSETTCEGGQVRTTSGLMAMTSATEWMEVQAVDASLGHVPVRSRSYRLVAPPTWAPASVLPQLEGRELAVQTARDVASRPLGVAEVEEAARFVMPEVVQAALVEADATISLDAATLLRLADAGVDEDIIDVMVALDNPDAFVMSVDEPTPERAASAVQGYGGGMVAYDDPFMRYGRYSRYGSYRMGFGYDPFFRGYDSFYSPYGYGYDPYGRWYRGGYNSGPIIIIERPGGVYEPPVGSSGRQRLRYVKGQGYTGASTDDARGARSNPPASSVGSSSRGSVGTASSGSTGSSSTGRKAKPKPKTGGGGGGG